MKHFLLLPLLFFAGMLSAQTDLSTSPWHLVADRIDPTAYHGITLGNGMVGLVTSAEPLRVSDVVLNGVFDTYGRGRVSNILRGFNFANVFLDVDEATNRQRISPANIRNFQQVLDMKRAVFSASFDHLDKVSVVYSLRSLRHLPFTSLIEVEITAQRDMTVNIGSELEAPEILREVKNHYHVIDRPHVKIPLMTSVANSPTGKHILAASSSFLLEEEVDYSQLVHEEWDYGRHFTRIEKHLKAGETFRFSIVASEVSTEHYSDPHNEAERLTIYAMLEGRDRLLKRHEAAWEDLWTSDIIVEGDLRSQKALRSALYHLYSFVREGTAYSPSPMGLSGLGYNGHAFWDTELWMYPPLLMLKPGIARSLLEYRYERLPMARQNARAHGYQGAMYPWESDDEGQEATPVWALTGPFEHHISGCVAVAQWEYYRVTKDQTWLRERGFPIMEAVADFWVSRVETDAAGVCHIYNVVGADEWAENVDDNAFTNGVAKSALAYAELAAKELGIAPDPTWAQTAACIPILEFADGTTQEYAGYVDTTVKQADVNLLAYPLEIVQGEKEIRKDLAFYEPRLSPGGPAMGYAALSVIYSRLGESEKAFELFQRAYQPNEIGPFGALAECQGCSNPYFATGAGGLLQAAIHGFGGLEATDAGIIQLKTKLPKTWKSLTITGVGLEKKTYVVK